MRKLQNTLTLIWLTFTVIFCLNDFNKYKQLFSLYQGRKDYCPRQVSGTTLITYDIEATRVIFDRNSVVLIQIYLLNQFREFITSLRVFLRGVPLG